MKTILIFLPFAAIAQAPMASYPFSGNANDASGNGHHGTVVNAVLTSDRFGNANSAYYFNGVDSYIDLGQNFPLNSHSFACWFLRDSLGSGNTMLSKINNGPYDMQNSELGINGFTLGEGSAWEGFNSTAPADYSMWVFVVGTYDATSQMAKIFVNTIADSLGSIVYSDVANTPLFVGARPYWSGVNGTAFHFRGSIDDIHIYNYALSPQQVDSLYNIGQSTGITNYAESDRVLSTSYYDFFGRTLEEPAGLYIEVRTFSSGRQQAKKLFATPQQ